jgi:predicted dehydrogenase
VTNLRAGVLGLGMMGRNHVRVLGDLEGVDLVAVGDLGGDPFNAAAGLPVVDGIEPLLGYELDLCVLAVPTAEHVEVGLQLAEAGVHTLVEKPLADEVDGARKLMAAFEQRGLVGCVGHVERYNPALQAMRTRLEAGELGAVVQIATRRQGPFPNRISDVGVVKDLATHDIDLTEWVAEASFEALSARTAFQAGRQHEDLLVATGTLRDGTITNHLVNWLTPMKERQTVVLGERGCFVADTLTADLTMYTNADVATTWGVISAFRGVSEGDMIRFAIPKPEPLSVELAAFRDAITEQGNAVVSMREGLRTLAVAETALEAAETGTTVEVAKAF